MTRMARMIRMLCIGQNDDSVDGNAREREVNEGEVIQNINSVI